jgi:hypothetical protein
LPFDDFILKLDGKKTSTSINGPTFTIGNVPAYNNYYYWDDGSISDNSEFILTKDTKNDRLYTSKFTPDPNRSGIKVGSYSIMRN